MRILEMRLLIILPFVSAGCVERVEAPKPAADSVSFVDSTRTAPAASADSRFSRNMVNTVDKGIPAEWSIQEGAQKNIKWAAKVGTQRTGYLPPVITGGKVIIATNNTDPRDPKVKGKKAILKCFRESDGQFLWQIVHGIAPPEVANGSGGSSDDDGLLTTPFVDGSRLYYVTPAAEVICADLEGKVVWRYEMMKELKVFPCYCSMCSPLVVGDRVFVVTGNGVDTHTGKVVAPEAPSFAAIDKSTGKLLWSCNLPGGNILDGQWTSPAYAVNGGKPQVIFPGGDGWLYALAPDTGDLIWKFDCNPKSSKGKRTGRDAANYLLAAPVVYENRVYIGVGHNPEGGPGSLIGHFWCIDITKTGDVSPAGDNFDPKAPANKNSALVWHFGGLIVPEPKKGRREHFGYTLSTAAVHDGLVYISELIGVLHCLDAKTGEKYWDYDMLSETWASPYVVDGKIFLGAVNGDVAVFAPGKTPPGKDAVKKNDMERGVKAPLVAANGTLYVVTETHLYAIAGK
jgi:outer membrane protein assembly factor BamB